MCLTRVKVQTNHKKNVLVFLTRSVLKRKKGSLNWAIEKSA